MNPVVNKLPTSLPDTPDSGSAQPAKVGASKFDQVRSQLKNGSGDASAATANQPVAGDNPGVTKVPQGPTQVTAANRVQDGLSVSQHHIARLKEQVGAMGTPGSKSGLEGRLMSVEKQYTQLDSSVKAMPTNANPQQWMALQQQVYSMNENINALSKLVGQAASGVKSILQTQV